MVKRISPFISKSGILQFLFINAFLFSETLPGIELKFSPKVGCACQYSYSVNLDKNTMGKTAHEQIEALIVMSVLSKDGSSYNLQYDTFPGKNNLDGINMDALKDKAGMSRKFSVSERYEFIPEEGMSLFFPGSPLKVGSKWEGNIRFQFGDLATSEPPFLKVRFELTGIKNDVVTLECEPVDKSLAVPIQTGMIGVRCDREGRIEELCRGSEAEERLKVGDVLIAINGQECTTSKMRNLLTQRYVEPANDTGSTVSLTILRGKYRKNIVISKFIKEYGEMKIKFLESERRIDFDLRKGIMISDVSSLKLSVDCHFRKDMGFSDNLSGGEGMEKLSGKNIPPRLYDYKWETVFTGMYGESENVSN
jgi:hypothetical protein